MLLPLAAPAAVCRVVSGNSLAFGSYDLLAAAPRDSQATLGVSCEGSGRAETVLLSIGIDSGLQGNASGLRRMRHAGGSGRTLEYSLYRDPGRSSTWGTVDAVNTVAVPVAVPASGASGASFVIYGRIPARQDAPSGSYGDAVQVTINY
jgi:spore coat protein U-like protein